MPDLAVIVPTRGRPENIRRVLAAWDFTNAWDVADLVLVVDADDPEFQGYVNLQNEARHPDTDQPLFAIDVQERWVPMVHKLNASAVRLAEEGRYFALGFAGDDHLPRTIGWAQTYLAKLRELGTGMVYGDDGYQGRKLSTEWAVTADAVRALGRMVPAPVGHMYCDNAMMDLFDGAGAMEHLPQVRIEHMHPIAGKAENDYQYQRVNSRAQFAEDRGLYVTWKNGRMSEDLATIRALRPGRPVRPQRKEKSMSKSPFPRHFKQVRGLTPEEIGIALADFAAQVPRDQAIVELGVFHGKTALQMAWGAGQANGVGNGAHIWAIDAWDLPGNVYAEHGGMADNRAWARYWVRGLGYSNAITLVHQFSQDAAGLWTVGPGMGGLGERPIGLLYVDGDHTYEGARRDIESWAPHLAPDARIAIDDYLNENYSEVQRAVDDLVESGVLAPVEVYHDRLAVTRLALDPSSPPRAITSEGVSPSPVAAGEAQTYQVGNATVAPVASEPDEADVLFDQSEPRHDSEVSDREIVHAGELDEVPDTTKIDALTLPNLKALAKVRGIVLGIRKDKRELILQALRDGQ